MNRKQEIPSLKADRPETSGWFDDILTIAEEINQFRTLGGNDSLSPEFRERCQLSGEIALSIAKLREERRRVGFVPLSFAEYLLGLVRVTGVDLDPILRRLQIDNLNRPGLEVTNALANLAKNIGVGLRETLIHIRIGFAVSSGAAPMPLLLARYRSIGSPCGHLDACEAVLAKVESKYDLDLLKELRRAEFEIRSAYRKANTVEQ